MRHGQGFLLVYSIADRRSFEEVQKLRDQIYKSQDKDADTQKLPIVMVGNKCDLEVDRQVSTLEGQQLAKHWGIPFIETSAKTRLNLDESFFNLVRLIRSGRNGGAEHKPKKSKKLAKLLGNDKCSIV
jgi:GTPase KRas protein